LNNDLNKKTSLFLRRYDVYLRTIIKQLCAITTLQQERLSLGDIRQLLAESVNLKKINKAMNEQTNERTNDQPSREHGSIALFNQTDIVIAANTTEVLFLLPRRGQP
jgi:hypothetical protein